jgi:hypothetical protein
LILSACRQTSIVNWNDDTEISNTIPTTYKNIEFVTNENDKFLYYDTMQPLLTNPDRGFRSEIYITLNPNENELEAYPGGGANPFTYAKNEFKKYKSDTPQLTQAYVYLTNYRTKKKIDAVGMDQLKRYFEMCKENNVRMLLRFAYATEDPKYTDAAYRFVDAHLTQIGEWIKENEELFSDTIYALQAGIVGSWGEGHHNVHLKNKHIGKVFQKLMDITPTRLYIEVRNEWLRWNINQAYKDTGRVGMHDDYIVGDINHKWAYLGVDAKASDFELFRNTINDSEMPWGVALMNDDPNGEPLSNLPGFDIIKQLSIYYMTSFSLTHNYKEVEGESFSMEKWKSEYVTKQMLSDAGVIFNPNLFRTQSGEEAKMSVYDFLRSHLGYQLVLSNISITEHKLTFAITNYGMAAPLNFNALTLVTEKDGARQEIRFSEYNKLQFQPGSTILISTDISSIAQGSQIGIKLAIKGGSNVALCFGNDLPYSNGVQILGHKL